MPPSARRRLRADLPPTTHNKPPGASLGLSAEQWVEWLDHVYETLTARRTELLASFERFQAAFPLSRPVGDNPPAGIEKWSDDIQGRAGDLKDKLQSVVKVAQSLHDIEKEPVLAATRAIDGYLRTFLADIEVKDSKGKLLIGERGAINTIVLRQTIYGTWLETVRRREAEAAAAEARRRADEAAAAATRTMDPIALDVAAEAFEQAAEADKAASASSTEMTRNSRAHGQRGQPPRHMEADPRGVRRDGTREGRHRRESARGLSGHQRKPRRYRHPQRESARVPRSRNPRREDFPLGNRKGETHVRVMVFDVETTGLPNWGAPSEDPSQPHLCQYTAVLFDRQTGDELHYVDMIIKPDGWVIPDDMAAIHGITTELALATGHPEADAVAHFLAMAGKADIVVAYNINFDLRIMRIAMMRAGYAEDQCNEFRDRLKPKQRCAMVQATPLAKVPPSDKMMATGRKTFKSPKLSEAVQAILGETMDDAHDARSDVLWTMRLWQHMNRVETMRLAEAVS